MISFIEHIAEVEEGVNDPAIFKAIFLAGGPGSGKSFIVGKTGLTSLGFKVVNSDTAFERAMNQAGMEMNPDNIFSKIPIADCISIHIPLTTENINYFE